MRVGLFLRHPFHTAIMEPIYVHLKDRLDCRMFVPPPADLRHDAWGLEPLRKIVSDLIAFRPHVVLSGDNIRPFHLRTYLPQTLFVHTRHGLASKGATYESARVADYACVTSPHMRQWYLDAGVKPRRDFWVVGYPQMDSLLRGDPLPLPFTVPQGRRVALYAPTFQMSLTSVRLIGERTLELLRGAREDVTLIIKPHPLIGNVYPQWMQHWRGLAAAEPHVHLVEDTHTDVMPYLRAADLLVTDLSSVALEYLALRRPMVLISSPHRFEEPYVDANGPEWRWRDMGHEIFDIERLPAAVSYALDHPTEGEARRQHYYELLFGELADGNAGQRIADHIVQLAGSVAPDWRMAAAGQVGSMAVHAVNWKRRIQTWRTAPPLWARKQAQKQTKTQAKTSAR
jgi:CDP-glycerol glycerophosphotransferase (TagB/SpsB family)